MRCAAPTPTLGAVPSGPADDTLERMRKGWGRPACLVFASAALVAGCTATDDDAAPSPAAPVPLAPGSHGPGTPLLDGFVVPDGARLVDGPLPPLEPPASRPDGSSIGSWAATMVVTEDPRPVVADLGAQATANGYVLQPQVDLEQPDAPSTSFCRRDAVRYRCAAIGAVRDIRTITLADPLPPSQLRGISLDLARAPASPHTSPTSFLTFTFHDDGSMAWGPGEPGAGPDAPLGVDPPPVPATWPALPEVGEPLEPDDHPHLVVLPGSTVLMPVRIADEGWSATSVLRVDGPVGRTFDRYVAAARGVMPTTDQPQEDPEETTVEDTRLGRVTWTSLRVETRDRAVHYSIMLLERPSGPATIRILAQWVPVSNGPA